MQQPNFAPAPVAFLSEVPSAVLNATEITPSVEAPQPNNEDTLLAMPLTAAKRLAAAEFERRYLVRVMERAGGSVSEGARLSGLDRTNFRRLLQRHGLRGSLHHEVP